MTTATIPGEPWHAHVYFDAGTRPAAARLQRVLRDLLATGESPGLAFIGELRDGPVGPHPMPQFELHFDAMALPVIAPMLEAAGLRTLVHPLTLDDLADHTTLARWIGEPLALDLSVLDPPGENRGIARYGKTDV